MTVRLHADGTLYFPPGAYTSRGNFRFGPRMTPIAVGARYACFIIGNEWRDRNKLPRNP